MKINYYLIGSRPVKEEFPEDGTYSCLGLVWETGEFELDWDAYLRIRNPDMDVEQVTQAVFDQRVAAIRQGLARER